MRPQTCSLIFMERSKRMNSPGWPWSKILAERLFRAASRPGGAMESSSPNPPLTRFFGLAPSPIAPRCLPKRNRANLWAKCNKPARPRSTITPWKSRSAAQGRPEPLEMVCNLVDLDGLRGGEVVERYGHHKFETCCREFAKKTVPTTENLLRSRFSEIYCQRGFPLSGILKR